MKHRGEMWTESEIAQLKSFYESGMKISDMSLQIGRSESAISKKVKELCGVNRCIYWSDEDIQKLRTLQAKGLSYKEIAKELNKTERACQGKAVRIGLKTKECNVWKDRKRADFWTDSEIERLKELADSGKSAMEIAESLGRSKKSLFYKMGVLNISIKEKSDIETSNYRRAYSVDDDYFEEIDTQKKAYFLGWLITDGWVTGVIHSKRGDVQSNKIGLKLEISDLDVIKEFREELKTDVPIKHYKARVSKEYTNKYTGKQFAVCSNEQCSVEVTSAKMKKDLEKYGVYPNKTYNVTFPKELKVEFYPGFIAGVLSGDGSVDVKKNHRTGFILRSSICGTQNLLDSIQKVLVANIGFNPDKIPKKSSSSEHLYIIELSQSETIRLYYWLKDNGTNIMSRKNKIIEDYMNKNPLLVKDILKKWAFQRKESDIT